MRIKVTGLIPTAYEPHDITFSADGSWMYIINGKSVTGPIPAISPATRPRITQSPIRAAMLRRPLRRRASNQYQFQLERASLVSAPVPTRRRSCTN